MTLAAQNRLKQLIFMEMVLHTVMSMNTVTVGICREFWEHLVMYRFLKAENCIYTKVLRKTILKTRVISPTDFELGLTLWWETTFHRLIPIFKSEIRTAVQ